MKSKTVPLDPPPGAARLGGGNARHIVQALSDYTDRFHATLSAHYNSWRCNRMLIDDEYVVPLFELCANDGEIHSTGDTEISFFAHGDWITDAVAAEVKAEVAAAMASVEAGPLLRNPVVAAVEAWREVRSTVITKLAI